MKRCYTWLLTVAIIIQPEGADILQEPGDILASEPPVAARGDAVRPYPAAVTPPPQRIGMDVKQIGYFSDCQHVIHLNHSYHVM